MCYKTLLKTFNKVHSQHWFRKPVFVDIQLLLTPVQAKNKYLHVRNLSQLKPYESAVIKTPSCYVLINKSCLLEGFRRWRGAILAALRNPDHEVSCGIANLLSIWYSIEQNSSKLRHTLGPLYGSFGKFKELTARPIYGFFGCSGLRSVVQ
jgi:hypothetical protein